MERFARIISNLDAVSADLSAPLATGFHAIDQSLSRPRLRVAAISALRSGGVRNIRRSGYV